MSLEIFLCVLAAAVLHAAWNAMVKGGPDKALSMTAVVLGQSVFGAVAMVFAPWPDMTCWPYLMAGVLLHFGYQLFLMGSYRAGDLTQVYPIARGTAPLLVAAFTVLWLNVELAAHEVIAVVLIGIGIISLSLVRQQDGLRNNRAALLAFVTGCFIAAYSIVDGLGVRIAGSALGFYGLLAALNGVLMVLCWGIFRPRLLTDLPLAKRSFVWGGGASFVAYALVVYAFAHAPIALVTALRETSIVFALIIGVVVLREPLNLTKLVSTMVTISGAALMRLGKG